MKAITARIDSGHKVQDVGGVEARVHRGRLARVDHEEDLVVATLRPHLLEGVRQLHVRYLFRILDKSIAEIIRQPNLQELSLKEGKLPET